MSAGDGPAGRRAATQASHRRPTAAPTDPAALLPDPDQDTHGWGDEHVEDPDEHYLRDVPPHHG